MTTDILGLEGANKCSTHLGIITFHSEHDRKELQFHMEPVITNQMWAQLHRMHQMVMARAVVVTPGRQSAGASQGRLNALSQQAGS